MSAEIYTTLKDIKCFRLFLHGDKNLSVYKRPIKDGILQSEATELITTIEKCKRIWLGYNPKYRDTYIEVGNSVLVNVKDDIYMYIADTIYYFRTRELVLDFVSPVCRGMSFPYIVTEKGYLLCRNNVFIPKDIVSYKDDFYFFYNKNLKHPRISKYVVIPVCDNYVF